MRFLVEPSMVGGCGGRAPGGWVVGWLAGSGIYMPRGASTSRQSLIGPHVEHQSEQMIVCSNFGSTSLGASPSTSQWLLKRCRCLLRVVLCWRFLAMPIRMRHLRRGWRGPWQLLTVNPRLVTLRLGSRRGIRRSHARNGDQHGDPQAGTPNSRGASRDKE